MSSTASASLLLYVVNMARLASLRRLVVLLGRAYAPTHTNYACYPNTPRPGFGRVVVIIRIPARRSMARGKTPPCQTKACAGTTAPPGGELVSPFQTGLTAHRARRLVDSVHSVRIFYGFIQPRSFVASFEEEMMMMMMMMMQEEGMITADEYSIDCRTCGNGKCA
jgi:hypothetical protein